MALALALASACHDEAEPPGVTGDPRLPGVAALDALLAMRLASAVAAKGPGYHPHTRHLAADGSPVFTNRLIFETSPYLLQHAHNPVSWYAWGDEPFARARREHKLVLVSIGYSTCHWCHVMEAESFEDEEVAAYLNANFICIKVDREERPDLDAVYMAAVVAMTGNGGWPMNVVVNAERQPVFGGTYLQKPQLLSVMRRLRAVATTEPARLAELARGVVASLAEAEARPGGVPGPEAIERAVRTLVTAFDPDHGGFGRKIKFPNPPNLELLLRYHHRTGDPDALAMVTYTLERIATGGIHDHLAGGFHRYATDRAWLVPHFEKMLYDNAQLAVIYAEAAQVTGDGELGVIAQRTLDYVLREMTSPEGGFYAATDADSPAPGGHVAEGYYFTWTAAELDAVLGPEAGMRVRGWYDVGGPAQVDGRSVLHTPRSLVDAARTAGVPPELLRDQLEAARGPLLAARGRRAPPARDDKILTAWNGLMISGLARAGFAFDRADYVRAAERAAEFVLARLRTPEGGLLRSFVAGEARQAGTLEDYADLVAGLLDLFEATSAPRWLEAARALAIELERRFADPAGGYAMTDHVAEQLVIHVRPIDDGVTPSGNAVAIADLLRLDELTGDPAWRARAERALGAFSTELTSARGTPALAAALDRALDQSVEIVIVAPHAVTEAAALVAEVRRAYLPDRTLVVTTDAGVAALARAVPMVEGKTALHGVATAFVCERTRCRQPTSSPAELATQLAKVRPLLPDRSPAPLRPR